MSMYSRISRAVRQLLGGVARSDLPTVDGRSAASVRCVDGSGASPAGVLAEADRLGRRVVGGRAAPAAGRAAILACLVLVVVLVLGAGSAWASTSVHVFSFSFGGGGSTPANPYPLSSPSSVAVDGASGDVYVGDPGNDWVEKFDSSGNLVWIIGTGVDQTTGGDLCTVASGDTCQAGTAGAGPGQFESPAFVAVDNSAGATQGDLYVADTGDNLVQRFHPDGTLDASWGDGGGAACGTASGQLSGACAAGGPFSALAGITVDGSGNLNVLDPATGNWFEFSPSGAALSTVNVGGNLAASSGIGVDSAGNLYLVQQGGGLIQLNSSGSFTGLVTSTSSPPAGFVIDPATDDVYADNGQSAIDHYDGSTLSTCAPNFNCSPTQEFGSGHLSNVAGLAVDASTGTVYVADPGAGDVAVFAVFPPGAPIIDHESANAVDTHEATLQAEINPHQLDTTCALEYGTDTSYSSGRVSCTPTDLGSGFADARAFVSLGGLQPGTTYHYRFVAVNSDGTTDGADHTFTTMTAPIGQSCPNAQLRIGPSAALPDCRAWEQVSPTDKLGLNAFQLGASPEMRAASDGNGLMYESATAYGDAQGSALLDAYLGQRSAGGWQTTNVTPPTPDAGPPGGYNLDYQFSSDLSHAVYEEPDQPLAPGAQANVENLFVRTTSTGAYSLITTAPRSAAGSCPTGNVFGQLCFEINGMTTFAGASLDYSHVIFESNDCLTPDAPCGYTNNLYEEVGGRDTLVGILPDGTAAAGGSQPGSGETASSASSITAADVANAISSDGSRIFFSAGADGGQPDPAQNGLTEVYERVNGSSTVEVSAPASGASPANPTAEPATYWGAASDGSLVFFTSSAELTTNANTGSGNAGNDLYEFNTTTGGLTDLSVDSNPSDAGTGANVQGVVGISTDGSYVYFVADGQLVSGQGTAGQPNLYLDHGGQISFIATLSSSDSSDWTNTRESLQSYVTPDGRHLAFTSTQSLTGYDNTDQSTGQPDSEVYEYSAPSGQLVCASCDPTGAAPVGDAYTGRGNGSGQAQSAASPFYQPRVLSDDGSRLFFSSPAAMTPGAGSAYDKVYEYENGTVSLLGAANSGPDFFLDASASGNDVFIGTTDQLSPSDQDQLRDVYDARVDGGFPAAVSPPSCQGDACQGPPSTAPPLPGAGTVTFTGPGNQSSAGRVGRVMVARRAIRGGRFVVTVKVPAAGRIWIAGAAVRTAARRVARAGSYRIAVRLTRRAERALRRRHRLRVHLRVAYAPSAGGRSSVSLSITVKR